MGTVIFHLVLGIVFLSVKIATMETPQGMEIQVVEILREEMKEDEQQEERKESSSDDEIARFMRSIATNENIDFDPDMIEEEIQQYVQEILSDLNSRNVYGDMYKHKKDENYTRDSLLYEQVLEARRLDSIKSLMHSGESSVSYRLADRHALRLQIPVFKCKYGGKVMVSILVNNKGIVQSSEIIENESHPDICLRDVAISASMQARFNEKPDAATIQRGTITYHFVKQ